MMGTASDANRSDPTRGAPAHSLSRQYELQHITQALAAGRGASDTGTRRRENRLRNTLLAFGSRHPSSRKVFVLGNGRAGTHWVGRVLDDHPAVSATIEDRRIFRLVKALAQDWTRPGAYQELVLRYRIEHARVAPLHYADKSHPALWFAERLHESLPDSQFIAIVRDPYGSVASGLMHVGVRGRIERWPGTPSRFLGVTVVGIDEYQRLSTVGRLAVRWRAHVEQTERLSRLLDPTRYLVISYTDLVLNNEATLRRLTEFLHLSSPLSGPAPELGSLTKWQDLLSEVQIAEIEAVTETAPTRAS
jgi:Sulfotransferase family